MERADLLSSGLMFAAEVMLVVWAAILLTAAWVELVSSRKSAPRAATISSTTLHGAEESTPPGPVSEALPQRTSLGRVVRTAH